MRYRRRVLDAVPIALGLRENHQPAMLDPPRNSLSETGPANPWLWRDISVPFYMLNVRLGESDAATPNRLYVAGPFLLTS